MSLSFLSFVHSGLYNYPYPTMGPMPSTWTTRLPEIVPSMYHARSWSDAPNHMIIGVRNCCEGKRRGDVYFVANEDKLDPQME